MTKRRIATATILALLLLVSLRAVISFVRFSRVEQHFTSIQAGQSRASVAASFGMPNYHAGSCSQDFGYPKSCSSEYVYSHPLAPILPEYYVVWFSSDDRVIDTEHLISP